MDAREGLIRLADYPFAVVSWVGQDGYPVNVAVRAEVTPDQGTTRFAQPAGLRVP